MRKRSFGLLFSAMLISVCFGFGAKIMTVEAQEAVLNEANIVEEPVATAPAPETKYTFTDMTAIMYAQNTVNVRNLPSTDGNILGRLSVNDEIIVTGQCNETGWYRFDYNGSVAYISNKYIGMNRIEVQQSTATSGHWYDGYQYGVWYDMGEYYFYLCRTRDELFQVSGTCTNGLAFEDNLWRRELMSRYPDRKIYYGGTESREGIFIALASTEANVPVKDPSWFRPKFIWE